MLQWFTMPTKPKSPKDAGTATNPKSKIQNRKSYTSPARLQKIFAALDALFPQAECALRHENAFQLLVATILSAQCTDERVNKVTPELFRKFPAPQDFVALPQDELEREIHSTGFFRNKAKSIIGAATKIVQDFGGKVPQTMEELLTLPGVARKTANVVLGTAFGIASGVVVDTHVFRIAHRLKLTKPKDAGKSRTGFDEAGAARPLGFVQSPGDLVWQKNLRRAQAPLRRVPPGVPLRLPR